MQIPAVSSGVLFTYFNTIHNKYLHGAKINRKIKQFKFNFVQPVLQHAFK